MPTEQPLTPETILALQAAGVRVCPRCGSQNLGRKKKYRSQMAATGVALLAIPTLGLALILLVLLGKVTYWTCKNCAFGWETPNWKA
ncbi:MAG TPA: hypothetical protein VGR43_08795 [Dehalococcoidia bacterium]|jgi:predicted RNA-binding Zn-ribbon protein involved in translation (DUF1610 family)|nr:hypothetical protein [Dehalococcoidia bacterium]